MNWWPWGRYTVYGARQQGREDGPKNFPSPDFTRPPGYLGEVKNLYEGSLRKVGQRWQPIQHQLKTAVENAKTTHTVTRERLGELESRHGDLDRRGHISRQGKWVCLGFLFLLEFPINLVAFQIMGDNMIGTCLVTLGLALVLLLCSDLVGIYLKEPTKSAEQKCGIGLLSLFAVLVILGVAVLREHTLAEQGEPVDKWTTYAFIVIQLLLYVVAVGVAYAAHDPLRDQREKVRRASNAVDAARNRRQARFRQFQGQADEWKDSAQLLMAAYEGENIPLRTDGVTNLPNVKLDVPQSLVALPPESEAHTQASGVAATSAVSEETSGG